MKWAGEGGSSKTSFSENPNNVLAYLNRAAANLMLKRYPAVMKDCEAALRLSPNNVDALVLAAAAFMGMDEYARAYTSADRAVNVDSSSERALAARSMAAEKLARYKEMLGDLRQLAEMNPPKYNDKFQKAIAMYSEQAPEFLVYSDGSAAKPGAAAASLGGAQMSHMLKWVLSVTLLGGVAVLMAFMLPKIMPQEKQLAMASTAGAVAGGAVLLKQGAPAADPEGKDEYTGMIIGGKYRVEHLMSESLCGMVFNATSLNFGVPVVVRSLPEMPEASAKQAAEMFNKFTPHRHLNIAETLEVIHEDGAVYVVSEMTSGTSLHALLEKQTRLPLKTALPIFKNICGGLDFLHTRNNSNGGLHPSDIILDGDEGFCRIVNVGLGTVILRDSGIYKAYIAPEGTAHGFTVQFDIYALGVCLYKTLTGVLPAGKYRPASELAAALPKGVDELLAQALAADPEERLDSAEEFYKLLAKSAGETAVPVAAQTAEAVVPVTPQDKKAALPKGFGLRETAADVLLSGVNEPEVRPDAVSVKPEAAAKPSLKPTLRIKTLNLGKVARMFKPKPNTDGNPDKTA